MPRPPVIITRPAPEGPALERHIRAAGWLALWLPAFDIGAAPEPGAVERAVARLAEFDLAIFVSPHAVAGFAPYATGRWPQGTMLGAVGEASERAAVESFAGAADAVRIAPPAGSGSGSEAFWEAWQATGRTARRVLIVRAQAGREWLAETFTKVGAQVDVVASYSRNPHPLVSGQLVALERLMQQRVPPIAVFTSSEAVASLDGQVADCSGAQAWLRSGSAFATHSRIAERLHGAGYRRVIVVEGDDSSILSKLESLRFAS